MKAIIVDSTECGGDGIYTLVAEDGEGLCSHWCSNAGFAEGDLYANRPERKEMFDKKGITEFVWLKDSGITIDELIKRNKEWATAHPKEETK